MSRTLDTFGARIPYPDDYEGLDHGPTICLLCPAFSLSWNYENPHDGPDCVPGIEWHAYVQVESGWDL